ncbi:N-acetyltransferase [Thalassotalea euphylliae]|uniref:N-acetyltransferase n=1 Tax=Thalassotalea euphylliae TaxID=1655234 RepID=A0A3E0TTJ0_9GAMM|nr:GNAT family N-acetyltransferase [Thalassotalea euphylliae]REL27235.1 N-acetyltransferase [Thalassotalea euphylliae]
MSNHQIQDKQSTQLSLCGHNPSLKQFYRSQRYSAKFKGYDQAFIITDTVLEEKNRQEQAHEQQIIAAVIISQLQLAHSQALLHALVVNKQHQKQGLAKQLLNYSLNHCSLPVTQTVCFANANLAKLYQACGFAFGTECELTSLLRDRYISYSKHQPELKIFIKEVHKGVSDK